MSATIRDVARESGVHASTVSRTFTTPHMVNPQTRNRVLDTAQRMGYEPHRSTTPPCTKRTNTLALVVADIANPFFAPMIKASASYARSRDYHVLVVDTDEDPLVEEELVRSLATGVDGMVLCGPRMSNGLIDQVRRQVPLVLINRVVDGTPAVVMDMAGGTSEAVAHLARHGHQHLALVRGPRGSWTSREIRRAATAAAATHGLTLTALGPYPPTVRGGAEAAGALRRSGATGVLAYNDLMAVGLIESLTEHGLAVPDDLSVVGIDDTVLGQSIKPRLTTVATPTATAGRVAVGLLLDERPPGQHIGTFTLTTTLVVRDSSGPRRHLVHRV